MKNRLLRRSTFLLGTTAGMLFWTGGIIRDSIPDTIYICRGEGARLDEAISEPLVTIPEDLEASASGSYAMEVSLLHMIPLKTVHVETIDRQTCFVSGEAVGIYMETDGVMIIDAGTIQDTAGGICSPAENIVRSGDYIMKVNGVQVSGKKELTEIMKNNKGEAMTFSVLRDGEEIEYSLTPMLTSDGSYKLGIWVRDDLQGIGTMTFVEEDGTYGALGHGISDMDTGLMLNLSEGTLYSADILSVTKGLVGSPGELKGTIRYTEENIWGTIEDNAASGIFGHLTKADVSQVSADIALKQEITSGPAVILCDIGNGVEEFSIEIEEISLNQKEVNKSFTIHVTDEELLERTGGIVQGLSGAPILQEGRLVGAVTHVFVNDPTRGYGIFAETMLEEAGSLS